MAIIITIQNRQRTRRVNLAMLRRVTRILTVDRLQLVEIELGINLVGDREMTRLNESFLQHHGSTDVITFDYSEPNARNRITKAVHGEIFVCVDEAIRQGRLFETSWQSEVVRYVVHGVLHLLGHDDKRSKARQKMKRVENRLVAELRQRLPFSNLAHLR